VLNARGTGRRSSCCRPNPALRPRPASTEAAERAVWLSAPAAASPRSFIKQQRRQSIPFPF
jgi:hypothetical protein